MKKHLPWLALPAIVTTMACAQPAAAALVTYTYTGAVDAGVDQIGLFGAAGGSLDHLAFTAVFLRDDALADEIYQGDINSYVRGPAAVTARLTIGDRTIDVGGVGGEQNQYDDGEVEGFSHYAASGLGGVTFTAFTAGLFAPMAYDYLAGPDYHTLRSLSADATPGFSWSGRFDFGAADPSDENRGLFTVGRFNPTSLVVGPGPDAVAVPEPASWAMMISGFAGLGAMLRRRRAALA